jgi:hypothetical protein
LGNNKLKRESEATKMKPNFIYKALLPGSWRRRLSIKNKVISFLPNGPHSNHEEIHKTRYI